MNFKICYKCKGAGEVLSFLEPLHLFFICLIGSVVSYFLFGFGVKYSFIFNMCSFLATYIVMFLLFSLLGLSPLFTRCSLCEGAGVTKSGKKG